MIPVFNAFGSTANAGAITTNGTFCRIDASAHLLGLITQGLLVPGQNSGWVIDEACYSLIGGSSGAGTIVTVNEFWPDGTFQPVGSPGPITVQNGIPVNGVISGVFLGLALVVSNIQGNGLARAIIKANIVGPRF